MEKVLRYQWVLFQSDGQYCTFTDVKLNKTLKEKEYPLKIKTLLIVPND